MTIKRDSLQSREGCKSEGLSSWDLSLLVDWEVYIMTSEFRLVNLVDIMDTTDIHNCSRIIHDVLHQQGLKGAIINIFILVIDKITICIWDCS